MRMSTIDTKWQQSGQHVFSFRYIQKPDHGNEESELQF